ncbi:hypothetical protein D3C76_526520 [compost metagenome]
MAQQFVLQRRLAPEQRAEAPGVGVAQRQSRLQLDIHMLVLDRRQAAFHQAQAAGHAEVADQRAGLGVQQQVFRPPFHLQDALPGQAHVEVLGNRPAQAPVTHDHAADALALDMGRDAPAGGFDFG